MIRCQTKIFLYWMQVSLRSDCKNLGSGLPSLMSADKPFPLLQTSLHMRLRLQEELSQPKNIRSEKYDLPISSDENEPFMVGLERTIIATILPTRPNTDIIVRNRPIMKLNIVYLLRTSCSCRLKSGIFTTSKPWISTFFPLYIGMNDHATIGWKFKHILFILQLTTE